MKAYATQSIRNVGIAGHGDTGKTQLVSSLLFTAGMTTRLGKVAEGSTVTDWDEEEIARKITIHTGPGLRRMGALAPCGSSATGPRKSADKAPEKIKINFLDTPGYSTFLNDTRATLVAADAALIVVDALAGVQVVTEKVWDYATEYDLPRAFVINWMDRELANFDRAMESIVHVFGRNVVPLQLPIGAEKSFRGVVDLITMKAHVYTPDGDGKPQDRGDSRRPGRGRENRARSAGRNGGRGRRRADGGVLREGHAADGGPDEGPARRVSCQAHLSRGAHLRAAQYRQRHAARPAGRSVSATRRSAAWPLATAKPPARATRCSERSATPSRCPFSCSRRWPILFPGASAISR